MALLLAPAAAFCYFGSISIALPTFQNSFDASADAVSWIIIVYQLGFSLSLIPGGRLGDVWGRTRILKRGLDAFLVGIIISMIATTLPVFIVGVALIGIAAGIAVPQVLAIVRQSIPLADRRGAYTAFSMTSGGSFLIGMITSGALLSLDPLSIGWREALVLPALLSGVGVITVRSVFPRAAIRLDTATNGQARTRFDVRGLALFGIGSVAFLFPIIQGRQAGWPVSYLLIGLASIVCLSLFAVYQVRLAARGRQPFISPDLFRVRSFRAAIATLAAQIVMGGSFFLFTTITLQNGADLGPMKAALVMSPIPIGMATSSFVSQTVLVRHLGRHIFVLSALLNIVGASLVVTTLMADTLTAPTVARLMFALALVGVGHGASISSTVPLAMTEVSETEGGLASGVLQMTHQAMGAIGTAIFGALYYATVSANTEGNAYANGLMATLSLVAFFSTILFLCHWLVPRDWMRHPSKPDAPPVPTSVARPGDR